MVKRLVIVVGLLLFLVPSIPKATAQELNRYTVVYYFDDNGAHIGTWAQVCDHSDVMYGEYSSNMQTIDRGPCEGGFCTFARVPVLQTGPGFSCHIFFELLEDGTTGGATCTDCQQGTHPNYPNLYDCPV